MTETSLPWPGTTLGDCGPYTADQWTRLHRRIFEHEDKQCKIFCNSADDPDGDNELEITDAGGKTLAIASGQAVVMGTYYRNTASKIITNKAGNTSVLTNSHYYSVVLGKDWDLQTVRVYWKDNGTLKDSNFPTRTDGDLWEVVLATVKVTAGGSVIISEDANGQILDPGTGLNDGVSGAESEGRINFLNYKFIWLGVQAGKPRTTNGCSEVTWWESDTYKRMVPTATFAHDSIDYMQWGGIALPGNYVTGGKLRAKFYFTAPTEPTISPATVIWRISINEITALDVEGLGAVTSAPAYDVNWFWAAGTELMVTDWTPEIIHTGAYPFTLNWISVSRDSSSDSCDKDVALIGVMLAYKVYD